MKAQVEAFLEHLLLNDNASVNTVRAYESDLAQFLVFLASAAGRRRADLRTEDVSHHNIRAFLAELTRRGNSRGSAARKLAAIRAFARYLRREGVMEGDPAALVGTPKREQRLPAHLIFAQPGQRLVHQRLVDRFCGKAEVRRAAMIAVAAQAQRLQQRPLHLAGEGGFVEIEPRQFHAERRRDGALVRSALRR